MARAAYTMTPSTYQALMIASFEARRMPKVSGKEFKRLSNNPAVTKAVVVVVRAARSARVLPTTF